MIPKYIATANTGQFSLCIRWREFVDVGGCYIYIRILPHYIYLDIRFKQAFTKQRTENEELNNNQTQDRKCTFTRLK